MQFFSKNKTSLVVWLVIFLCLFGKFSFFLFQQTNLITLSFFIIFSLVTAVLAIEDFFKHEVKIWGLFFGFLCIFIFHYYFVLDNSVIFNISIEERMWGLVTGFLICDFITHGCNALSRYKLSKQGLLPLAFSCILFVIILLFPAINFWILFSVFLVGRVLLFFHPLAPLKLETKLKHWVIYLFFIIILFISICTKQIFINSLFPLILGCIFLFEEIFLAVFVEIYKICQPKLHKINLLNINTFQDTAKDESENTPSVMGGADPIFLAIIGAFAGVYFFFFTFILGLFIALIWNALSKVSKKTLEYLKEQTEEVSPDPIPFIPFLVLAYLIILNFYGFHQ